MNNIKGKKVVVGMSGGVDSSVTALLLKKAGYDVVGVTMNVWQKETDINCEKACCATGAVSDARRVAEKLGIPYYALNFRDEFKKHVIDYFAKEYMEGKTPNPCIACNKYLKFDLLLEKAKTVFDADYIATGHYAKVEFNENTNRYYIKESVTAAKDQTYALYNLSQEQLKHIIMPLGDYTKDEVREIARKNGLINANKHDSQEICFVEDNDYAGFIERKYNYKSIPGEFVDTKGNKYGKHKGIIHYTVGQRRGLGLSLKSPLYVKRVDTKTHEVILCPKEELYSDSLICDKINLMSIASITEPINCSVKIRYSAPKVKATLIPIDTDTIKVVFNEPQRAITPGQAVVFYDNDIVIGGGTIK